MKSLRPNSFAMTRSTRLNLRFVFEATQHRAQLDVVGSRTDGQFFLRVVNTHGTRAQSCRLAIEGFTLESGKAF